MGLGVLGLVLSLVAVVGVGLLIRVLRTPPPVAPEPPRPLRGAPPDPSWLSRPRPGELWDLAEGRQGVVLRVYPAAVDVLWVARGGPDLTATAELRPDTAFTRRLGQLEPDAWAKVQAAHRTGYGG